MLSLFVFLVSIAAGGVTVLATWRRLGPARSLGLGALTLVTLAGLALLWLALALRGMDG